VWLLAGYAYFAYGTQTVPLLLSPSNTGNVTDYSAFNNMTNDTVTYVNQTADPKFVAVNGNIN